MSHGIDQNAVVEFDAATESIRPPTDREFHRFQDLIERETGIHLSGAKKALLVGRLRKRLRRLELRTFSEYYRLINDDASEMMRMIDCVCTNETRFFREPHQFDLLRERIVPEWLARAASGGRERRVRVWSAACSTGEEPYSLAMLLLDLLSTRNGWEVEIIATDLSSLALEKAMAGVYPSTKESEIPPHYLTRYMLKGVRSQEGLIRVGPAVRDVVRFGRVNLNDLSYPVGGPFDLIFCRNMLIYLAPATKRRVINQLLDLISSDGYLFLGHSESVVGMWDRIRHIGLTAYALLNASEARSATSASSLVRQSPRPGELAATVRHGGRRIEKRLEVES